MDLQQTDQVLASEPLRDNDEPPTKRARHMSKTCEACRAKKAKCDSLRPQCSSCQRKGTTCTYREKGQPGLRPGFGKAVESRIDSLEDSISEIKQTLQSVLDGMRPNAQSLRTRDANNTYADVERPPAQASNAELNDIFWPPTGIAETAAMHDGMLPLDPLESPATAISGQLRCVPSLPSVPLLTQLVNLFFKHVYPWFPIFHRPSFEAVMYEPEREILLHGIVVTSFRFWRDATPSVQQRNAHVKYSRERILLATIDDCTLLGAQTLALAAIDALGEGTGPRAWNSMSLLVTATKHLELMRSPSGVPSDRGFPLVANDPDDDRELTTVQCEERKRLFWAICSLDRFSSVSHGQPGGIDMRNIRLPYPKSEEQWQQDLPARWYQAPTLRTSFPDTGPDASQVLWHHYIDALAFVDRSNQVLIQPVNLMLSAQSQEWQSNFRRLDAGLTKWFESLPAVVREPRTAFDPIWIMLHATVSLIRMRLYTVAAFPSTTSPYVRASAAARMRCRDTVAKVAAMVRPLERGSLEHLPPMFAFILWVAARSLAILWTTHHETSPGPDMDALLAGLRQMATQWPCAQRYADLVQLIMDDTQDPARPKLLEVFNDTRRTAYGLEKKLGMLAGRHFVNQDPFSFDFLDIPFLDNDITGDPWMPLFPDAATDDWL